MALFPLVLENELFETFKKFHNPLFTRLPHNSNISLQKSKRWRKEKDRIKFLQAISCVRSCAFKHSFTSSLVLFIFKLAFDLNQCKQPSSTTTTNKKKSGIPPLTRLLIFTTTFFGACFVHSLFLFSLLLLCILFSFIRPFFPSQ